MPGFGKKGVKLDAKGFKELGRQLRDMEVRKAARIVDSVGRSIAKDVADAARSRAPSDSGRLKRAIIVDSGFISPKFFAFNALVRRAKSRNDQSGTYYAHWIEYGHRFTGRTRFSKLKSWSGSMYPPHPFMRPAWRSVGGASGAINRISKELFNRISGAF